MSENIPPGKDGGPAFPETRWSDEYRTEIQWTGMSLRDYIAAKALTGFLSHPSTMDLVRGAVNGAEWPKEAARAAYIYADAMIAESQKK